MIDRNEMIDEQRLRKIIRRLVEGVHSRGDEREKLEEQKLRGVIRKLILLE